MMSHCATAVLLRHYGTAPLRRTVGAPAFKPGVRLVEIQALAPASLQDIFLICFVQRLQ